MSKVKLKPCSVCGVEPVLEYWVSGRMISAVRCNNPDRPDSCDIPFYYSRSSSSEEAIIKWNAYQSGGEIYEEVNEVWNFGTLTAPRTPQKSAPMPQIRAKII